MKTSMKTWLVIITVTLALLASLVVVLRSRPEEPVAASDAGTSEGPSFEVRVVKPRITRPLFGLLPNRLEEKLERGGERRFDHTSPGARIGSVGQNRLELSADGWNLFVETDGEGSITPATHLVYTMELAGKQRTLRCRPAEQASGYLQTTRPPGSDRLDGSFRLELATCENAETGKVIAWPPAPLTVSGSFRGLPQGGRQG